MDMVLRRPHSAYSGPVVVARLRWGAWAFWTAFVALSALGAFLGGVASWTSNPAQSLVLWMVALVLLLVTIAFASSGLLSEWNGGIFRLDRQGLHHCGLRGCLRWEHVLAIHHRYHVDNDGGEHSALEFLLKPQAVGAADLPQPRKPEFLTQGDCTVFSDTLNISLANVNDDPEDLLRQARELHARYGLPRPAAGEAGTRS